MDGRKSLLLALSLWTGALGCASLNKNQPPPVTDHYTLGTPEDSPNGTGNEPKQHTPLMCVAAGDFFMHEAAAKEDAPALQQNLYERARKAYQQANQLNPNFLPGYQGLANWYLTQNDYDHAIVTYKKAIQVAPNTPLLLYELGMCYCRKKDWNNGLASLNKAVELDPENRQYVDVLGFTLARMGRYDDSLACLMRVQPKAKVHYYLARMLEHMEQMDLCRYHLEIAVKEDPELQEAAQKLLAGTNGDVPAQAAAQPVQQVGYEEIMITQRLPVQPPQPREPQKPAANSVGEVAPASTNAGNPEKKEQLAPAPAPAPLVDLGEASDLLPPPPPLQIDPSLTKGP